MRGILTVLALLFLPVKLCHSDEPVFEGRPLHAWLDDLRNTDPDNRARVERALHATATNAIPWLLAELVIADAKEEDIPPAWNGGVWMTPIERHQ